MDDRQRWALAVFAAVPGSLLIVWPSRTRPRDVGCDRDFPAGWHPTRIAVVLLVIYTVVSAIEPLFFLIVGTPLLLAAVFWFFAVPVMAAGAG